MTEATTEAPKAKKFYKQNERIWIKALKRTGVVKSLDTKTKIAIISHKSDTHEATDTPFYFWEIDKLRAKESFLEIPVKYLAEGVKLEKIEVGDWIDVSTAKDISLLAFQDTTIPLGFAMQLPPGYEAHVAPRSSTYKKWRIIQTNSIGVVDNSYSGDGDEWGMPVLAIKDTFIPKGTRVAQFRIVPKMGNVRFVEKGTLGNPDRGGFGSTGN